MVHLTVSEPFIQTTTPTHILECADFHSLTLGFIIDTHEL